MANKPTKEQIEVAEEFKKVADKLAQPLSDEELPNGDLEEVSTTDAIPTKFIQIILQDDLPQISYNGMSIAEVLGTLKLSEQLILDKKVTKEIKKQTYQKLLEYDLVS